jgi:hypothetical protein
MSRVWRIVYVLAGLTLLSGVWLWWNQFEPVDMAEYVPADTLIYLEADSIPEIVEKSIQSDAWQAAAPAAGVEAPTLRLGPLTTLARLTGIGSHESVIFARAQVAVCILGFNAAESSDASLKISPRGAVVFETHAGEWRVRAAVEKSVGSFARRTLGAAEPWRREENGAAFYTWVARDDERKRIVAAVYGTVAVIGNDEAAVQACLAVRRGEKPSLSRDPQLGEMRARLGADGALGFGFAPSGSAAKVFEAVSPLFVSQTSEDPRVQGMLAGMLPKLAQRVIGAAAWSTHFEGGAFVDKYYMVLPGALSSRLSQQNVSTDAFSSEVADFLPPDAHQVTTYNYAEPEAAWLALNAGLSTQVDALHAPGVTLALESLLEPYGILAPRDFLRAASAPIVTARLNETSEDKLLIVRTRDAAALLEQARKQFGDGVVMKKSGERDVWVSAGPERRAAVVIEEYLITGAEDDVFACLAAHDRGETLSTSVRFKSSLPSLLRVPPHVHTLTSDEQAVKTFFLSLSRRRRGASHSLEGFDEKVRGLPYVTSETVVTNDGVEKHTRSALGQFGAIYNRLFAPDTQGAQSVSR